MGGGRGACGGSWVVAAGAPDRCPPPRLAPGSTPAGLPVASRPGWGVYWARGRSPAPVLPSRELIVHLCRVYRSGPSWPRWPGSRACGMCAGRPAASASRMTSARWSGRRGSGEVGPGATPGRPHWRDLPRRPGVAAGPAGLSEGTQGCRRGPAGRAWAWAGSPVSAGSARVRPAGLWKRLVLRTVRMGGPAGSPRRPGAWVLGAGPGRLEGQNSANRTKSPAVRESAGGWPRPRWPWGHLATPWGPCAWEVSASPSWAQCHLAETPPPHPGLRRVP